jgi:hypothetical protein
MRRRHWLALVVVAIAAAVAVPLLLPRDHPREEVVATRGAPSVPLLGPPRPGPVVLANLMSTDGRMVRVRIVPCGWQPTFWVRLRFWLGLW